MEADPVGPSQDAQAGWDVPAAEVPALEPARATRATGEVRQRSPRLPLRRRATR